MPSPWMLPFKFTSSEKAGQAQDVFAQMGGMSTHQSSEQLPQTKDEGCSEPSAAGEEENIYAGLEIYEEYQS